MFPTRINVGQLLLTFGRYVAIGAVEGLPEKHTPSGPTERVPDLFYLPQLCAFRKVKGYTQEALSQLSGVGISTIIKAEAGGRVKLETTTRLAEVLGVPVEDIAVIAPDYEEEEEDE